jgi:large subunit ribosomal protein L15
MKLHDLRPAEGARKAKTRVGRGIAAGKGKTAGRGTKGQKARAGGSIPPWFEGGQTPLHMRIPKLRGFKNRFRVEYEVVNVGSIEALVGRGAFETEAPTGKATKSTKGAGPAQITINADILRAVGLVRTPSKPLKILGAGDLSAALFVVADAYTASARAKIEAAGGIANVLEIPSTPSPALGVDGAETATKRSRPAPAATVEAAPAVEPEPVEPEPVETAPAAEATAAEATVPAVEPEAEEAAAAPAEVKAPPRKAARTKSTPGKTKAEASTEAETTSGDDA